MDYSAGLENQAGRKAYRGSNPLSSAVLENAPVAQWIRVQVSGTWGRAFESPQAHRVFSGPKVLSPSIALRIEGFESRQGRLCTENFLLEE